MANGTTGRLPGHPDRDSLLTFPAWSSATTRATRRSPDNTAGPLHNKIPEPAADNNSTYWKPSFNRQHYLDMFFNGMPEQDGESFKGIYKEMSSGRFDLEGDVSNWVTVPNNEASYGQTESNQDMTRFITDSATAWYNAAEGGRQERRRDQGVPQVVRHLGPLRLRR